MSKRTILGRKGIKARTAKAEAKIQDKITIQKALIESKKVIDHPTWNSAVKSTKLKNLKKRVVSSKFNGTQLDTRQAKQFYDMQTNKMLKSRLNIQAGIKISNFEKVFPNKEPQGVKSFSQYLRQEREQLLRLERAMKKDARRVERKTNVENHYKNTQKELQKQMKRKYGKEVYNDQYSEAKETFGEVNLERMLNLFDRTVFYYKNRDIIIEYNEDPENDSKKRALLRAQALHEKQARIDELIKS